MTDAEREKVMEKEREREAERERERKLAEARGRTAYFNPFGGNSSPKAPEAKELEKEKVAKAKPKGKV